MSGWRYEVVLTVHVHGVTTCTVCCCGAQTKRRTHVDATGEDEKSIPRSFIIQRGKVDASVLELVANMRRVMSPYTALKLKPRK